MAAVWGQTRIKLLPSPTSSATLFLQTSEGSITWYLLSPSTSGHRKQGEEDSELCCTHTAPPWPQQLLAHEYDMKQLFPKDEDDKLHLWVIPTKGNHGCDHAAYVTSLTSALFHVLLLRMLQSRDKSTRQKSSKKVPSPLSSEQGAAFWLSSSENQNCQGWKEPLEIFQSTSQVISRISEKLLGTYPELLEIWWHKEKWGKHY